MFYVDKTRAAVATCSLMSELATGKTVDEAYELDDLDIMPYFGDQHEDGR